MKTTHELFTLVKASSTFLSSMQGISVGISLKGACAAIFKRETVPSTSALSVLAFSVTWPGLTLHMLVTLSNLVAATSHSDVDSQHRTI